MTTLEQVGPRIYFRGAPFGAKGALKDIGAHWDADERCWWIGTAKRADAERLLGQLAAAPVPTARDGPETVPDDARVLARVKHAGRSYYVVAETAGRIRCRIVGLDGRHPRWVDCAACELVREYPGREERGAYGRPTGRTVYTTLGSLRRFVQSQRDLEAKGAPICGGCGKRAEEHELIEDLEDGILKHPHCCDIPPSGY